MVDFGWSDIELSNDLQDPDYDIADGMNLIFKINTFEMAYPQFYFNEDDETYKPSVITIADSYYWNYHGKGITQRIYENDNFWYYYEQAHGSRYKENQSLKEIDRLKEIKSVDFVVILFTDANLYKFASGFIDDVYDLLKDPYHNEKEQKEIEEMVRIKMEIIKGNEEWYKILNRMQWLPPPYQEQTFPLYTSIKTKATDEQISVEEMLKKDAIWLVNQELNK